jgi:hypothetical protein
VAPWLVDCTHHQRDHRLSHHREEDVMHHPEKREDERARKKLAY